MLEVMDIPLVLTFPSDWIKMVVMQPHVHLTDTQPFRWPNGEKEKQIAGIKRTLEIAKNKQAHFTLFPEYSIPGLDAIDSISTLVIDGQWPNSSVVIGGVDGLSNNEYQQLCTLPNTNCHPRNGPDHVGQTEWVNCSVTWVKDNSGSVTRYIQPKICPAWPEKNIRCQEMFCGKAIYLFNAKYDNGDFPFSFISLICFDWIGKINGSNTKVVDGFLQSMDKTYVGNPQCLHWIFVLQENDEPNHNMFIQRTSDFLTQRSTYPMVNRQNSTIVFVNNSTKTSGGNIITSDRAFTSCVFPADVSFVTQGAPPTISFASERFRGKLINRCNDVIFRELRPCIHSFKVRVAQFLNLTQDSKCHPIEYAFVHPIDEHFDDPRFPDGPVPACVKWVNDELDNIESLSTRSPNVMTSETNSSHERLITKLRNLPGNKQQNNVHYTTASHSDNEDPNSWTNADSWDIQESEALEHLLHTTTICGIAENGIDLEDSKFHARTTIDGKLYEIVAIRGHQHPDCKRHFDNVCMFKINHPILLISRDIDNNPFTEKFSQKITKINPLGDVLDPNITDVEYSIIQKGYRELLNIYQNSNSQQELVQGLVRYVA